MADSFHFSVNIISRGKGKSAVASAAYISGEKIKNEWDGVTHDYTRKEKVLVKNIILPDHIPKEFNDRSTLWNKVEMAEKNSNALYHFFCILQCCSDRFLNIPAHLGLRLDIFCGILVTASNILHGLSNHLCRII